MANQNMKLRIFPEEFYSYDNSIKNARSKDFKRLDGLVYLDHAGTTLYPESLLRGYHEDLCCHVYGNPHSTSESSRLTTDVVDQMRARVLDHFHTTLEDYSIIFTSGCTDALKLVVENFDFQGSTTRFEHGLSPEMCQQTHGGFCYLEDNHTSVVGMREVAKNRNAKVACMPVSHTSLLTENKPETNGQCGQLNMIHPVKGSGQVNKTGDCQRATEQGNCLFVYPAQSNFSGCRYPLSWIDKVQSSDSIRSSFHEQMSCSRYFVLLDAASFVSTSSLDLSIFKPDFVALSFYKMFGFPTGLGALLVRNDRVDLLSNKIYFGGGTVHAAIATEDFHVKARNIWERFEDGTIAFLDIIALKYGFESMQRLAGDMQKISTHTFHLARHVYNALTALRHDNGKPVAIIYCDNSFDDPRIQGPIITMNFLTAEGEFIGYSEVEKLAHVYDIQFRTGCFCNLGACQRHLGIDSGLAKRHFKSGHVCGDGVDLIDGRPTGCIRVSLGYSSTLRDVEHFLEFVQECFQSKSTNDTSNRGSNTDNHDISIEKSNSDASHSKVSCTEICEVEKVEGIPTSTEPIELRTRHLMDEVKTKNVFDNQKPGVNISVLGSHGRDGDKTILDTSKLLPNTPHLSHIFIYPVKSCAAFEVNDWPLGSCGLLYDRQWMVVTETGVCLSQKREPLMCLLQPEVDVQNGLLRLSYPGLDDFELPLHNVVASGEKTVKLCPTKVCADRLLGEDCGDSVASWLQGALNRAGLRLIKQSATNLRLRNKDNPGDNTSEKEQLSLANEAQYLLINQTSVEVLARSVREKLPQSPLGDENKLMRQFRANMVISATDPYSEDKWKTLTFGKEKFEVQMPCVRCQMICVDQETGLRSKEPLLALLSSRNRKATFGILLSHGGGSSGRLTKGQPYCIS